MPSIGALSLLAFNRCWRLFRPFWNGVEQLLFVQIHNSRLHRLVQIARNFEPIRANTLLLRMLQVSRYGYTYSVYYLR